MYEITYHSGAARRASIRFGLVSGSRVRWFPNTDLDSELDLVMDMDLVSLLDPSFILLLLLDLGPGFMDHILESSSTNYKVFDILGSL